MAETRTARKNSNRKSPPQKPQVFQNSVHYNRIVENTSVRLIAADRDLKIVYLNPASIETLQELQHLLPCPVSEMLGQSIIKG